MEAILKFNLPEDHTEFQFATQGPNMYSVLWDMDQWLRGQYKYMPDEGYSADKYNAYYEAREHLRQLIIENNVNLDL